MPKARVLVVDDDPVIQRLLQVNFEMEDYQVLTAGDGEEGLERARREAGHRAARHHDAEDERARSVRRAEG